MWFFWKYFLIRPDTFESKRQASVHKRVKKTHSNNNFQLCNGTLKTKTGTDSIIKNQRFLKDNVYKTSKILNRQKKVTNTKKYI